LARKILLADDSVTAQNMGRRILSEAGYEVITVNNGSAALKKIAEQKPDLVILDVYMPGYGGLEVCQRMKEGQETLDIPVLLTVGKLEPFRADEARRVHADAHLVKPFEASELLAALTKLEDRIVPRAEGGSVGKDSAAGSRAGSARGVFGDSVTGWKSRLAIPSSTPKPGEEVEAPQVSVTAFRDFEHPTEDLKPVDAPGTVASIYNGMVQDITAEEIAAIAAAAAAFGEKTGFVEFAHSASAITVEEAAASVASAADTVEPVALERESIEKTAPEGASQAEVQPPYEPEASVASVLASAVASETATENESPAVEANAGPEVVTGEEHAPVESVADAEVVAALESLAPAGAVADGLQAADQVADERVPLPEEVADAMGSVAAGGLRWIAEEIPLAEGEASFILEREMQKVFAALAEANAERVIADAPAEAASSAGDPLPAAYGEQSTSLEEAHSFAASEAKSEEHLSVAPVVESPEVESAAVENSGTPADEVSASTAPEDQFPENHAPENQTPLSEEPEPVVEAVVSGAESASQSAAAEETTALPSATAGSEEPPSAQAEAVAELEITPPITAETNLSGSESAPESAEATTVEATTAELTTIGIAGEMVAEPKPEAAYAAAASVGAGFRSINAIGVSSLIDASSSSIEAVAQPGVPSEYGATAASAASAEVPQEREAELAAAWAHWRQIRETIGSAQPAPHTSDGVAEAGAVESASGSSGIPQEASRSLPELSAAATEAADPASIASIVDSMLAELRPRLVEEIAKKLGKERK
jgi:CheY-like chemotaxis protein